MKVFLTHRAEKNYETIREYIKNEWGPSVAESFEEKVDNYSVSLRHSRKWDLLKKNFNGRILFQQLANFS